MNAARRPVAWLAGVILLGALAGPAAALLAPQNGQDAYEIQLRHYDLFNYHSAAADLARSQAESATTRSLGGIWNVYFWNPQSRTAGEMYGSGVEIAGPLGSSDDVRAAAERIIGANPATFRAAPSGLRFTDAANAPAVTNAPDGRNRPSKWAAHFQQVFDGIDVVGGEVHLIFTESGRLFALGSNYYPDISVGVDPSISLDRAREIARDALPYDPATDSVDPDGELQILPVPLSETEVAYHLVWLVRVHTADPLGQWATRVDAHSGEILQRTNEVDFLDYFGYAVGQIERTCYCDGSNQETMPYVYVTVGGVGATYADNNGYWWLPHSGGGTATLTSRLYSPYVDVQNQGGPNASVTATVTAGTPYTINFTNANSGPEERDVYRTVQDIHNFFETFAAGWGFTNQRVTANVNLPQHCNAFYQNNTINFYSAGGGCTNTGRMMDVVAHEYGHGIQESILGWQGNEGLGEGNGDVTGFLMTMSPLMGRGLIDCWHYDRDADNTLRYPDDVIGHEIHDAGRVIAGFHWDAMEDQIADYGQDWGRYSTAYDWFWGRVLEHPTTQPAQVLATFIANDDDGDLTNGTPQYNSYCLAATNHGFTCPTAWLPLASGACDTYHQCPQAYEMTQSNNYWTGVAVNPSAGDDKDMSVYTSDGHTLLAYSNGTVGTDFVVGDFNHNSVGSYEPMVTYGEANAPYVVAWDDGADAITLGTDVTGNVGGGGGSCGLIRVWDVYLTAGSSYRFYLANTGGSADVRMAFFRNPTSTPYWAGRSSAVFELTSGNGREYTAPVTDYYGVVVFNNSPGDPQGSYLLRVQASPVSLTSGTCQTYSSRPRMFSFSQMNGYWAGVAVNPATGDDKDVEVYDNPDGIGTPLASSTYGAERTDFVVGDFNHATMTTYYPRVFYGLAGSSYAVEWDDDRDMIQVGTPVNGTVGGSGSGCGVIRVWDVYLSAGQAYRFGLDGSGSDVRMCLFRNPASAPYWAGRGNAEFELAGSAGHTYTAPASDFYGVVVFNDSPSSPSGTYTLWVHGLPVALADGQCQTSSFIPTMFSFAQSSVYWTAVAVNPAGGDDKDVYLYNNQDGLGGYLGYSTGTSGTDFVVGDFNHNPSGTYYALATYGGLTTPYVVDWDDGPDLFYPGQDVAGTIGGGGTGGCGLVRIWDVYLTAGKTYRAYLTRAGTADIRVSLFRNPTGSAYWAGRGNAAFELPAGAPGTYTAPASDYYGLVVFNASAGSPGGTYTLRFQEAPIALTGGACQTWSDSPRMFSSGQLWPYWSAVAVDPAPGDDKDITAYTDPDGETVPIATSQLTSGTDFIVQDFNHSSIQTFYTRVTGGSTGTSYVVEWDDEADLFPLATTISGSVGGGTGNCGVVRIWDLALQAGNAYQVTLTRNGTADIHTALFYNPANAPYAAGRGAAAFDKAAADTPYIYAVPASDYYGLVVFNNSPGTGSGTYTIRVDQVAAQQPDLMVEQVQIQPATPSSTDPVQVRGLVKNQGTAAAPASTTRFYLDGGAVGDEATPALAAGQDAWTDWLSLGILGEGSHLARACADALNAVPELSETNNCLDYPFTVLNTSGVDPLTVAAQGIQFANPYAPGSPILLWAENGAQALVSIYDVSGQLVRSLHHEAAGRGVHRLRWDGRTDGGSQLGSGLYFVEAQVGAHRLRKTLLLVR